MRATGIDAAVVAANPTPAGTLDAIRIADTGADLLESIEHLHSTDSLSTRSRPLPRTTVRRRGGLRTVIGAAAVAAAAAILSIALAGNGTRATDAHAYPQVLVRYAANSPLVLLALDRWHVSYVLELTARTGEMHFLQDGASERQLARAAQLSWQSAPLHLWPGGSTAEVLGAHAHVFDDGSARDRTTYLAEWRYRGLWLSFRATTHDALAFRAMLAALRPVDERAWLSALPASVIKAAERPSQVSAMLAGIPLPPGFDASRIPGASLTESRYQFGAAVAGAVACTWFKSWAEGRADGDAQRVQVAVAAMGTSPRWSVLRAMQSEGAYPQVLEEYAADMSSGLWHGHPLAHAAAQGLGCAERGVMVPLTGAERRAPS